MPAKVGQHCCPNEHAKILAGIQGSAQQISSCQLIFFLRQRPRCRRTEWSPELVVSEMKRTRA
jgi:hypothetical protein